LRDTDGLDSLSRVFARNPAAQVAGVEIGTAKVQAEQCPELVLQTRAIAQERARRMHTLRLLLKKFARIGVTVPDD